MKYKALSAIGVAAISTVAVIDKQATDFKTYVYAGYTVHDVYHMAGINGAVEVGKYCLSAGDLVDANPGDVAISMRANSAEYCRYVSPDLPTIAVAGWDNENKFVGDSWVEDALTISAGASYGKSVNYYIPEDSVSAAMPVMANVINTINSARRDAGLAVYDTAGIRRVLDASSDGIMMIEGNYHGQLIDLPRAIEIATAPPVTVDWMAGILSLILENNDE